jgi:hypothetical protein
VAEEVIVYYRKDPSWLATSPLAPPVEDSPDTLVEVHREEVSWHRSGERQLEDIWVKLQNIDSDDLAARLGVRSMMHGDMIVLPPVAGGLASAWQCEMVGWRKIRPEWLVKGDFPKLFPELMSCHEKSSQEDTAS